MISMLAKLGDVAGAKAYAAKAMGVVNQILEKDPVSFNNLGSLRGIHQRLADLLIGAGDGSGALEHAREELRLNEQMRAAQPSNTNVRRSQALAHFQLGKAYKLRAQSAPAGSGDAGENWRQSRSEFQQSAEIYQELKAKNVLAGPETKKLDEIAIEIGECEAALKPGRAP